MTSEEALRAQFNEFLAQQNLENGTIPTNQPPKPQPIELELGGQKVTFNTKEEMQAALQRQFETAAEKIATLEQAVKSAAPEPPAAPNTAAEDLKIAFYEKFKDDPFAAVEMAMKQSPIFRDTALGTENQRQLIEIARFKDANPTFNPATDGPVLDNIRASLGLPITAAALDAAYATGLKNGIFRLPQQPANATPPPTPGRFQPSQAYDEQPPAFDPITAATIDNMPIEQLEKFLRSQGAFG